MTRPEPLPLAPLPASLLPGQPHTALAPMQDVTDLAFMGVIATCGAPDWFVTEFFRVHGQSRPEKHILRSIDENATGRPVFAQLIGEDLEHLARTARALLAHPVAGIDLNLGCPAPQGLQEKRRRWPVARSRQSRRNPARPPRRRTRPFHCQDAYRFRGYR